MARRRRRGQPKYGGATRDDQGRYWKDGIEVDRYGNPWERLTPEQVAANTSTPGTGVGGTEVPEVGDQSISADDPKNIKIETPETILTQSGDDWGMEDLDDYFGTDLANMNPMETTTTTNTPNVDSITYDPSGFQGGLTNPFSSSTTLGNTPTIITTETGNLNPALETGIKKDTDKGPPKLPEETSDPNFSSDYTDSGIQTLTDPEDTIEEETTEAGYIPGKRSREKGGVGQIGGRQAQFGRKQMVTGSKKASILAP